MRFAVPLSLLAAATMASAAQYNVIYRFQGGQDGYYPAAALLADKSGNLYGTTVFGGGSATCSGTAGQGCGTVFELTPPSSPEGAWTESVLYRFQGGSDGAFPQAPLVADAEGNLYGATSSGGGSANCGGGCGTAFKLAPPATPGGPWSETVIYPFQGVKTNRSNSSGDAAQPNGLVFDRAGALFGMASSGGLCQTDETGTYCQGAVFRLTPPGSSGGDWRETILYEFRGHAPTGNPAGPILGKGGELYGTAGWGQYGSGMVFTLMPPVPAAGSVYSFGQFAGDGAFPNPGLVFDQAANLYGTTFAGGAAQEGTVYRLSPPTQTGGTWSESILYAFTPGADGEGTPNGGLALDAAGNLYGTTQYGGSVDAGSVFQLTPPTVQGDPWTETILHSFTGASDGQSPYGGILRTAEGVLYGVTTLGGGAAASACESNGVANSCGVVYQVTP